MHGTASTALQPISKVARACLDDICIIVLLTQCAVQESHNPAIFPLIFDDSIDIPDVSQFGYVSTHDEGVLVKAEAGLALLSMSGYGKPHYPASKGELYDINCDPGGILPGTVVLSV